MRLLGRNKITIYYCLYDEENSVELKDSNGHLTGERKNVYKEPVACRVSFTYDRGNVYTKPFGLISDYSRIFTVDDLNCPISEGTLIFTDNKPELVNGIPVGAEYMVTKVAKTLNFVSYLCEKDHVPTD